MNDYSGMLLHQAKLQDQLKEARESRLLAERPVGERESSHPGRRRRLSRLLWAAALAILAALRFASV